MRQEGARSAAPKAALHMLLHTCTLHTIHDDQSAHSRKGVDSATEIQHLDIAQACYGYGCACGYGFSTSTLPSARPLVLLLLLLLLP